MNFNRRRIFEKRRNAGKRIRPAKVPPRESSLRLNRLKIKRKAQRFLKRLQRDTRPIWAIATRNLITSPGSALAHAQRTTRTRWASRSLLRNFAVPHFPHFPNGLFRISAFARSLVLRTRRAESAGRRDFQRRSAVANTPTSLHYAVNPIPCILDIKFSAGLLSSALAACVMRESQSARSKAFLFVSQCLCHVPKNVRLPSRLANSPADRRAGREENRARARRSIVTLHRRRRHREAIMTNVTRLTLDASV